MGNNPKVIIAPDGGWGYVVMMSAFFVAFLIDGIANSFGLLLPILVETFQVSVPLASLSSGVLTGVTFLIAPITARLVKRFGHRPVAFLGGLITFGSMATASVSVNIEMFIVFYGAIAGMGLGLVYLPALTMVNAYFERKRGVVMGVVTCGSGVGLLIMAFLVETFIEVYSWRGCLLIISGFYLNLSICASLLRPLQPTEDDQCSSSERSPSSRDTESTADSDWSLRESDDGGMIKDHEWLGRRSSIKDIFKGDMEEANEPGALKSSAANYQLISNRNIIRQLQAFANDSEKSTADIPQIVQVTEKDSADRYSISLKSSAQDMLRVLEGKSGSFVSVNGRMTARDLEEQQQPKDSRQRDDIIIQHHNNLMNSISVSNSASDIRSECFLTKEGVQRTGVPGPTRPLAGASDGLSSSFRNCHEVSRQHLAPPTTTLAAHSRSSSSLASHPSLAVSQVCQNGSQYMSHNFYDHDDVRFYKRHRKQQLTAEPMMRSLLGLSSSREVGKVESGSLLIMNQPVEMVASTLSIATVASRRHNV